MRRTVTLVLLTVLLLALAGATGWTASVDESWIRYWNPSLRRYQNLTRGAMYTMATEFARLIANESKLYWCDDFMEAAAVLGSTVYSNAHWTKTNGAGSGTATITAGANGLMVLDTLHAAQNDDVVLTFRTANFAIAKNPQMETLVQPNNLTNCIFEVGWYVDGNDELLFRFNPAVDATDWQIYYENNNGGEQVYDTGVAASASGLQNLRINVLSTGAANCYINGTVVKAYPAGTVRNVAFKPRFYARVTDAGHAASKTLTIDYCKLWQDR